MREAAAALDMPYKTFIYRAKKFNVYTPNQGGMGSLIREAAILNRTIPLSEILEGRHPEYRTQLLKQRMISEGVIENVCEGCDNEGEWNGRPLVLELDHVNGNPKDHRRENLRLLCPNCHSQTPSFRGRKS